MYKVLLRSSDSNIGWFVSSHRFASDEDAHEWATREVNSSKEAYLKCAEANIDVPFFVEYMVRPE